MRAAIGASDTMKPNNPHLDQLFRILSALDGHFRADDCSPADADRWRELKWHILRMLDGLALAHIELESGAATEEMKRKALQHVRFGLGEETK
jgi:hypothetical protein